jgi:hypothetical protein
MEINTGTNKLDEKITEIIELMEKEEIEKKNRLDELRRRDPFIYK